MNDIKLLPLAESPIKTYQFLLYPLAVLFNYEECMPWFYSNYIQLRCTPNKGIDNFAFSGSWWFDKPWGYIPWFDYQIINKTTFFRFEDKSRFIREQIDDGWYFYSFVDKFYIPDTVKYYEHHFIHDLLIYGYDANLDYIAYEYNDKKVLNTIKVTPADLMMSLELTENVEPSSLNKELIFFKKKGNYHYEFDMELVYDMLNEYLYSKNTYYKARFMNVQEDNADLYVYGMDCYKCLINYFYMLEEDEVKNDIMLLQLLWEHKKCMLLRLEYMFTNNCIPREDKLYSAFHNIEVQTLILRNMQLKYSISSDKRIIEKIIAMLKRIEDAECSGLDSLLECMKKMTTGLNS